MIARLSITFVIAALMAGFEGRAAATSEKAPAAKAPDVIQDTHPLPAPANAALPSLVIVGDSTVRNGRGDGGTGQWGWGDLIAPFFDRAKLNVVNRALGGRSTRTYISDGHWAQTLAVLKRGDFLLIQFGHNDTSPVNDDSRARGTLKGVGEETQEIDNLLTHAHETVHTYGWYLRRYIHEAKAAGAQPILCSPVPRNNWKDGKVARNSGDYGKWAREVAQAEGVPLIDLNALIADRYDQLGSEKVDKLFLGDHTHTSYAGAELNAACVVAGLRALPENPLAQYLKSDATK